MGLINKGIKISEFSIKKLFGVKNLKVPIKDNKLILVGENGTGKSTFINILYSFLTFQWEKLQTYEFESVSAKINNRRFDLSKDNLKHYLIPQKSLAKHRLYQRKFFSNEDLYSSKSKVKQLELFEYMSDPEIISKDFNISISQTRKELPKIWEKHKKATENISNIVDFLKSNQIEKILYLPTYRRIEHELKDILPKVSEHIEKYEKKYDMEVKSYIEFVRFGMEDVKSIIDTKMEELYNYFNSLLNNLSGKYLGEVIKADTLKFSGETRKWINSIDENIIDALLIRIENEILSRRDKEALKRHILSIKNKKRLTKHDKIVLQYFINILAIYFNQNEKEVLVNRFVKVCNGYLHGKSFSYDTSRFKLNLYPKSSGLAIQPIELDTLSSGEKQVVSIFSHIYLSTQENYLLLIDEPELSLSVPWQKMFLTDISKSETCRGLFSATHSPFIFENELEEYTHSIEEFVVD
jgi:predicted ATPase